MPETYTSLKASFVDQLWTDETRAATYTSVGGMAYSYSSFLYKYVGVNKCRYGEAFSASVFQLTCLKCKEPIPYPICFNCKGENLIFNLFFDKGMFVCADCSQLLGTSLVCPKCDTKNPLSKPNFSSSPITDRFCEDTLIKLELVERIKNDKSMIPVTIEFLKERVKENVKREEDEKAHKKRKEQLEAIKPYLILLVSVIILGIVTFVR